MPAGFPPEVPLQAFRRPVGPPLGCDLDLVSWEVLYHPACSPPQDIHITASEYKAATEELPAQQVTQMQKLPSMSFATRYITNTFMPCMADRLYWQPCMNGAREVQAAL